MSGRPLSICFVAYRGNMRCGGQGVYLWFLARELTRLGHTVDVMVGPPYPDEMPFARALDELPNQQYWAGWFAKDRSAMLPAPDRLRAFEPLQFFELGASKLGFLPEPFAFSLRAFRRFAARLRQGHRYDVVHDVQCLGWGLLGIRALGVPVVATVHHPLSVDRRASFARDETFADALGTMTFYPVGMQSFVARRLEAIFTSSEASARHIERDFGVSHDRLHMVANGLDTTLFRPDSSVPREPAQLLCVGRASDPNKGVGHLVDALARLPRSVQLTLVDDDHPGNAALRRASELGCADRLQLVGRVSTSELVTLYRRATITVVPSIYEGFGLPAAEAMACGTPVVATAAGALAEVLRVGGGGVLVPPGSPEALAKGIAALLEQPHARREMSARAPARIHAAYSWSRVARATADVYHELRRRNNATRDGPWLQNPAPRVQQRNQGPSLVD